MDLFHTDNWVTRTIIKIAGNKLQWITEHGSFRPVCFADILRTALTGMLQARNDRLKDYLSNE